MHVLDVMRLAPGVALLVTASVTLLLVVGGGAAAQDEFGPRPWELGMEWTWGNGSASQHTVVDDHTQMATHGGTYDVWMTKTTREEADGSSSFRVSAWEEGTHRRVYDEVHTYSSSGEPMRAMTEYSPPTAFPVWGEIGPGAEFYQEVEVTTNYMVGMQPAGGETTTWDWVAVADYETYNLTTPAGTFEGFNVTVYREEVNGSRANRYEYFYAHEPRTFVATLDGEGETDFELTDYDLRPPPVARGYTSPPIADVGENVTLYGHRSKALDGEIADISWKLPAGAIYEGQRLEETTRVEGENVTVRFPEPGRYTAQLNVTATNNRSAEVPIGIRVADRSGTFKVTGPRHALVDEPTSFRLVPSEGVEVQEATWRAEGIEPVSGTEPAITFPREGRYTLNVTYTDSEGNTGSLTHDLVVVDVGNATSRGTLGGSAGANPDAAGMVPGILSPDNGTRFDEAQTLIVARAAGLDDPKLMLPNGLGVPLDPGADGIDTAQVPLPEGTHRIELVDGNATVDAVTLTYEDHDAQADGADRVLGTNDVPFPGLAVLLFAPLLRRNPR